MGNDGTLQDKAGSSGWEAGSRGGIQARGHFFPPNLERLDPRLTRCPPVSTSISRKLRGNPLLWSSGEQRFLLHASVLFPEDVK